MSITFPDHVPDGLAECVAPDKCDGSMHSEAKGSDCFLVHKPAARGMTEIEVPEGAVPKRFRVGLVMGRPIEGADGTVYTSRTRMDFSMAQFAPDGVWEDVMSCEITSAAEAQAFAEALTKVSADAWVVAQMFRQVEAGSEASQ